MEVPSTSLRPQRPPVTSASDLARAVGLRRGILRGGALEESSDDVRVTGIELRAQNIVAGDVFAALPGARSHGATFAADALSRGAVAVVTDDEGLALMSTDGVPDGVAVLVHPRPRDVLGALSAAVYDSPSSKMTVIGITGTSGKTTTSYLVEAALRAGGRTPGLIGTIETRIGTEPVPSALTTPEAPNLHAMFAAMYEQGVDTVVMEVSSHALSLGRVDGTSFAVGAFTNLSQDHLDFHHTFEDYFAAKARLFAPDSAVRAARAVVCIDDQWGRRMADIASATAAPVTVSTDGSGAAGSWTVGAWAPGSDGTQTFEVSHGDEVLSARLRIPGRYNVANAVLAAAVCAEVGVDPANAFDAMATVDVPGRMQRVERGQSFLAVVDYAHKPAALDAVLSTLRASTDGRIAVVVGAGGDRDAEKRPIMGRSAATAADLVIITDDNPRSEDPAAIRTAIRRGADEVPGDRSGEVREISPRDDAIDAAVRWARPGDVVLVAGKGHEVGQDVGGTKHPFDDRLVLAEAIERLRGSM
ncbi:UDP-N-acetylmuramoylalanyl-D-glutamate--2,6-diaminopimelate ligase [Rhodococcus sp. MEB064]|nr:UDP-N-acetylmuramoyl-L-alanyl-D-glutamate--2,6-diaminopimelate ligase [Rhodococcus sp. MEB064]KIQ16084.1 UDP-N-acetylmuramoylalanyl-D-glutamate--2,6-diaminopimelate ligase [Rhodococcus sp. MEB064]